MSTEESTTERGFTLQGDAKSGPDAAETLPKVDFSTFVLSFATSAMYHMGLSQDPSGEDAPAKNLPLARQTIDTLEMFEEKTRGNLDEEETKLIQAVLYELRMNFVRVGG